MIELLHRPTTRAHDEGKFPMIRHLAAASAVLALGLATVNTPADAAVYPRTLQPGTITPSCYAVITVFEDDSWGGGPLVSTDPLNRSKVETWNWATPKNMRRFGFPPHSLRMPDVACSIRLQRR